MFFPLTYHGASVVKIRNGKKNVALHEIVICQEKNMWEIWETTVKSCFQ